VEELANPVGPGMDAIVLRRLVDGIDAAVYEVDPHGWCKFVNRHGIELFGYPEDRWLSQPRFPQFMVVRVDRERVKAHFAGCARSGGRRQFDCRMLTASGEVIWTRQTLIADCDDRGKVGSLRGVMWKIDQPGETERRFHATRALLAEQLADMTVLHQLSQRLWGTPDIEPLLEEIVASIASLQGAEIGIARLYDPVRRDLRIVASVGLSPEYLDRYGRVAVGDVACGLAIEQGKPVIIGDIDTDVPSVYQEPARAGGYRAIYSTLMTSRRGEVLGTLATCFHEPHRPNNREIRLVELFARQAADFIENAQLKLALRQSDGRKDLALAALAHEIRNPLNAIMSSAEIVRMEAADRSRSAAACELLLRQARLMARLTDELIETSRAGAGKLVLNLESVDLSAAMIKAAASVSSLIEDRHHQLAVVPPAAPIEVEADPVRLEQILVNLLTNASVYTDPGGTITLDALDEGARAAIRVKDTGVGIAPEMIARVFEPYVRAERNSARPTQTGLGLGLTLVKIFVERQGGSITAVSDGIGKGSEFVVRLPKPRPNGDSSKDGLGAAANS
jgi:signal transduction histidine kinase